jgi:hypothetical protein
MITIALIGCSKTKSVSNPSGYAAARDLYSSDLFAKRVAHIEDRGLPWYILSAKSGLLKPSVLLRSYNATLSELSSIEIAEWHLGVANQLMTELWYEFREPKLSTVTIELHAGAKYCEPLASILELLGVKVIKPVANLSIGKQLQFYLG